MREKRRSFAVVLALIMLISFVATGCARKGGETSSRSERTSSRGKDTSDDTSGRRKTDDATTEPKTQPETESISEETVAATKPQEPLVFDDRKASYSGTTPEWETLHFEWENHFGTGTFQMDIPVDKAMYRYYCGLERYIDAEDFYLYADDESNGQLVKDIIKIFREIAREEHLDDADVAKEIAKFVQDAIEYELDTDSAGRVEYPRYPVETLYERRGDCEDTSILMASLLKEWGFEVGFLLLPGHCAVAIRAANDYDATRYYEIDGRRYLYIESTGSGWTIGTIPDEMMEYGVQLYLIP